MKMYKVTYQVRCYEKKDSCFYTTATGSMVGYAKNKLEAINMCLDGYQWDAIYEEKVGFKAKRIEFVKFISVEIVKDEEQK